MSHAGTIGNNVSRPTAGIHTHGIIMNIDIEFPGIPACNGPTC